jgi:hypothetical protein
MSLIPRDLAEKIPKLYGTESKNIHDKVALVRLYAPGTYWAWYVVEYDGEDECFGLVKGHEVEFGYFSVKELDSIEIPHKVVRDEKFEPTAVSKLKLQGMSEGE